MNLENIKLPVIINIDCSGRENLVHYFRRETMNIFGYFS